MEPKDLVKVWNAPDNSKLSPKQFSLRLPILVSAKISALCEMYPRKSKTEIIGDLLATALDQFADGLESIDGKFICNDPSDGEPICEDIGPRRHFSDLTDKYLRELESEIKLKEK